MYIKTPFVFLLTLFGMSCSFANEVYKTTTVYSDTTIKTPPFQPGTIEARLEAMPLLLAPRYSRVVEGYLKRYLLYGRDHSENILGRIVVYFPMFEELLAEKGLPDDLKYLAIVESALHPEAKSRVGAMGLWQFMPETGAYYGLKINSEVDERCDPVRSTEAALAYLKKQYERFGDWALAIAAYNSGPGRVRRAIRRAGSTDFWRIRRYLPKETRNYVPAFIAAAYLARHYHHHGLKPRFPGLDFQMTESRLIYRGIDFQTLVRLTDLPIAALRALNPAYRSDRIPRDSAGYYLTLPRRVFCAVEDYLLLEDFDSIDWDALRTDQPQLHASPESPYYKSIYTVARGDRLEDLAELFYCSTYSIAGWNHLEGDSLQPGQEIVIYQPRTLRRFNLQRPKVIVPQRLDIPEMTLSLSANVASFYIQ